MSQSAQHKCTLASDCKQIRTQQKASGPVSASWKVAQLASKLQLFLPTQFAFTTAIDRLESHVVLCINPVVQDPPGAPNDAKSTDEIVSPAGQPIDAFVFSGASMQVQGGCPGGDGDGGGGCGKPKAQPCTSAVRAVRLFTKTSSM